MAKWDRGNVLQVSMPISLPGQAVSTRFLDKGAKDLKVSVAREIAMQL